MKEIEGIEERAIKYLAGAYYCAGHLALSNDLLEGKRMVDDCPLQAVINILRLCDQIYERNHALEIELAQLKSNERFITGWKSIGGYCKDAVISHIEEKSIDLMQFREAVLSWAEDAENDLTDERLNKAMRLFRIIDGQNGEDE